MSFQSLKLIEPILKALETEGYSNPTPIQQQAIPFILQQRDILGCAQTGTGKTAAFAIPILQILHNKPWMGNGPRPIRSLILTPTRELAIQIGESFSAYGRHTKVKHTVIFGGVPQKPQTNALQSGIDVLIATPGRLLDLMAQKFIFLDQLQLFVLDEADRMLDMGFIHDVKKVIAKLPAKRQSLFFSATMPPDIIKLASTIVVNPVKVEVTPESLTVDAIRQAVYFVDKTNKRALLAHILEDKSIVSALVFTRTKHGADRVAKDLNKVGIKAEAIHGNKSQNQRQKALSNFKTRFTRVLVATDIAARGIDVDELSHVINYEIPNIPETYVHRIGRTGRAGLSGVALSFCDAEEKAFIKDIHKLISKVIPVVENHPYPMESQSSTKPSDQNKPNQQKTSRPANSFQRNENKWSRPGRRMNSNNNRQNG